MDTSDHPRSRVAATLALLAAGAGIAFLAIGVIRFVGSLDDPGSPAATSLATPTSTVASAPSTVALAVDQVFVPVTDDSGAVAVEVPAEWIDTSGSVWAVDEEVVGKTVAAATDLDAWYSTWGTPGAFVGVSDTGYSPGFGDFSGLCDAAGSADIAEGALTGSVRSWTDCGAEGGDFLVFVGGPIDGGYVVLIQLVDVTGTGRALLDHILTTFSYSP